MKTHLVTQAAAGCEILQSSESIIQIIRDLLKQHKAFAVKQRA